MTWSHYRKVGSVGFPHQNGTPGLYDKGYLSVCADRHRLIRQNRIPSYKIGARRLFDKDELIEWVKTQRSGKPRN
ncbi:MAG: helix-turn-helix domain-containing protein [Desulfobacterales bacterium]|nr:helix-turn-helix domain-containing protein [Desulfobacterales bacterium]